MPIFRPALASLALGCVLVVTACGARTEDVYDPGPPANPSALVPEPTVYRVGVRDHVAQVLAIDPESGRTRPFGPPLPAEIDERYVALHVTVAEDGKVLVTASPGSIIHGAGEIDYFGSALALLGDGATWRELRRSEGGLFGAISSDGSHVLLESGCGDAHTRSEVLDTAGASLWSGACNDGTALAGVAPDGRHVVLARAGALVARDRTGSEVMLSTGPEAQLLAIFSTSVLLRASKGEARWLDYEGRDLHVSGFSPVAQFAPAFNVTIGDAASRMQYAPPALRSKLQVTGGTVAVLDDRSVASVQKVPSWVAPERVSGFLPGRYLVAQDGDGREELAVVGPGGEVVSRYERAPGFVGAAVDAIALDAPWPWVVVGSGRFVGTYDGDIANGTLTQREELWLLGDAATGRKARTAIVLATSDNGRPSTSYFPSPRGRFVFVHSDGALRRVAIADGSTADIAPGWFIY